jgi:hypothetical protein
VPNPGLDVEIVETFEPGEAILDTSQGMFAGYTEYGAPLTTVHNMADYRKYCGGRNGASKMYDSVGAFFGEGGKTAYIGRNATVDGVPATGALGTWAEFTAKSQGLYGNDIDVKAVAGLGANTVRLQVIYKGVVMESSPNIADYNAAVSWAAEKSSFVYVSDEGADSDTLPAVDATAALTGGTDGAKSAADYQSGLDLFTFDLGPGQVNCPGEEDTTVHLMVGAHVAAKHRCGVIDLPNTDDAAVLSAAAENLWGEVGMRQCIGLAPWILYPGDTKDSNNVIPYGGMEMGIIAKVDRMLDPSLVAAGANAISKRALGLANDFADDQRYALNQSSVSLGRFMYRNVRTYGYRTLAGPSDGNWRFFQESRVIMNIAHQIQADIEQYVFNTVDGLNHLFVKIKNTAVGVLMPFFISGALYGATPSDAFRVVCDATNNTDETIALGEVHVTLYLRTSKVAEWIKVDIIKVPTEEAIPA